MTNRVSEVRVSVGVQIAAPPRTIRLAVDDQLVNIPVDPEVNVHFFEQFLNNTRTPRQKNRLRTLNNLMRAAYRAGVAKGKEG